MSETEFVQLLLDFVFGGICFYCGYRYCQYRIVREAVDMIHTLADKLEGKIGTRAFDEETGETLSGPMYELKHEYENGIHYFYFKKNNAFAGQGTTLEEAAQHFKHITKGEGTGFFKMSTSDDAHAFIDGEVHEAAIKKFKL